MIKQKKLQLDFITKKTIVKKFWARATSHIAMKTQKSQFFGIGGRIFYRCARGSARAPKIYFTIEKFIKFSIFYIFLIFSYHLNSWFYSGSKSGTFDPKCPTSDRKQKGYKVFCSSFMSFCPIDFIFIG